MSLVKYRIKEVATDFGMSPKDISNVVEKFFEKPKSPSQILTEEELNVVFDYMTQKNQISSLEEVFAVQPKPKAEAPKQEAPKQETKPAAQQQNKPQQQNKSQGDKPQGRTDHRPRHHRPRNKRQG